MGGGVVARSGTPTERDVAYFVVLAGILSLLLMLCCYFFYFFIKKVKELSRERDSPTTPTVPRLPQSTPAYPIQPVVRESATAMAKLCKQIPTIPTAGGKSSVFPTSTSPEAMRTGGTSPAPALPPALAEPSVLDKIPTNTESGPVEIVIE